MSDRSERDLERDSERDLERDLEGLTSADRFPPTPDIARAVRQRIEGETGGAARMPLLGALRLGRGMALALLALVALAGTVIAAGLVIGGLRIVFVDELPSIPPTASASATARGGEPGGSLGLGEPSTVDEASERAGFEVLLPSSPRLARPDAVYFSPTVAEGMVSLVYGEREGMEAGADGVAVLVTQFRADVPGALVKKVVESGSDVQAVRVGESDGFWISGGPHVFLYREPSGDIGEERMRLVGNTLIWQRDGLLLRLESDLPLEDAIELAESIR